MIRTNGKIRAALAGQPNSGKSTLFNMLTGSRQHVANFPGVTVEKKWGRFNANDSQVEVVDLPGTYSLTSYSQEERIARDFLLEQRPEVVVAVVDASNLERSLYLVFQLLEMGVPMVLSLNMMDVAERRGFKIDVEKLRSELGIPVVPTVAKRGEGCDDVKRAIAKVAGEQGGRFNDWKLDYGLEMEQALHEVRSQLDLCGHITADYAHRWLAVKLLENDADARRVLLEHPDSEDGVDPETVSEYVDEVRNEFKRRTGTWPEKMIADRRYETARQIVKRAVVETREGDATLTDRIDSVVLHPVLAPLILVAILFLFYQIVMVYGTKLADWLFPYIHSARVFLSGLFPASSDLLREGLLKSMLMDGLVGGVVAILYYVPIFLVLFALIAILEDSGYMARVAFVMDRLLRWCGLHGQSTLPLILGGAIVGGCAVPATMATRTMKDERARLVTILIMPLMNCLAKIPFYVLIVGLFFAAYRGLVLFGISLFSFCVAMVMAKIFSKYLTTGQSAPFVMELPSYHLPTFGGVTRRAVERVWLFIKKIVTIVAAVMIVVWFGVTFPGIGLERELFYDRQVAAAEGALRAQVGAGNPYARYLNGAALVDLMAFQDRYNTARSSVSNDEAALRTVMEKFRSENHAYFLIANKGTDIDGSVDRDARVTHTALRTFGKTVKKLSRERRKESIDASWAGQFGRFLEPVSELAGFNWRINIAILSSFAAKESLVGTLGAIYSVESTGDSAALGRSIHAVESGWTMRHALAILIFVALFPPCLATLIMIRHETGSTRWMIFAAAYPIILGFVLASAVFQLGGRIL